MSAGQVDVIGAMDYAAKQLRAWQRDHGEDRLSKEAIAGLREAREAVRELVEAVSAIYGEPSNQGADSCAPNCMSCRVIAALAPFAGASK